MRCVLISLGIAPHYKMLASKDNQLGEISITEAKKDWIAFQEPILKDEQNEIYKPDLVFVKGDQAIAIDVTVRYESKLTSLSDTVAMLKTKFKN